MTQPAHSARYLLAGLAMAVITVGVLAAVFAARGATW